MSKFCWKLVHWSRREIKRPVASRVEKRGLGDWFEGLEKEVLGEGR